MRIRLADQDRAILALAFPAFLALIAEPLFLLADAAIVGHLGTAELAGLGIAAAILQTIVGLCVFLAYGTTASVARLLGAGDLRSALTQGVDGLWLAVIIGILATGLGLALAKPMVGFFDASAAVNEHALTYLRIALLGTTPLLLMLATTGVLRGLQDTRTPLVVAVAGNIANVICNLVLVYGFNLGGLTWSGLGLAGSALGSVLAQVGCAAALIAVVVRQARKERASLRPDLAGIKAAGRAGLPLIMRTLTLRASLLVGTWAVVLSADPGRDSEVGLATHQIALTLWSFLAFALDAIAIAAQALTGRALGAGDAEGTRAITRRMIGWGIGSGILTGLGLAACTPFLGPLFTGDDAVRDLLVPVLLVAALGQPLAGVVFVLDGVLIGAGDGRYLAWTGLIVLAVYAPIVLGVAALIGGLVPVWLAMVVVFMGARGAVLVTRARTDAWLVLGAGHAKA